jgi:hypothetical protein
MTLCSILAIGFAFTHRKFLTHVKMAFPRRRPARRRASLPSSTETAPRGPFVPSRRPRRALCPRREFPARSSAARPYWTLECYYRHDLRVSQQGKKQNAPTMSPPVPPLRSSRRVPPACPAPSPLDAPLNCGAPLERARLSGSQKRTHARAELRAAHRSRVARGSPKQACARLTAAELREARRSRVARGSSKQSCARLGEAKRANSSWFPHFEQNVIFLFCSFVCISDAVPNFL